MGIICPGSQRLVSKGTDTIPVKAAAPLRRQEDENVQRPGELRAVHRRNGRAYQRGRPAIPLRILPLRLKVRRRGGNSDYQDLGLEVDEDDPTDS